MLERLEVRDLGIIDTVALEPTAGFVALTGETGAGKSLLVESLKLLEGQRAQSDLVRTGADRLRVEGWFSPLASPRLAELLEELGAPAGESLVIRREVTASGRSRAWLNDVPVTAATLQRVAPFLLAIHGQHEQYGLADSAVQRRLVDEFGGHDAARQATRSAFQHWHELDTEVRRLRQAQTRRRDRLDTISFQLGEIEAVAPVAGEEEELRQRRQLLRHAARLSELSRSVLSRLAEGESAVLDELTRAGRQVEEMVSCGVTLTGSVTGLGEARIQIEEVVREVQDLTGNLQEDPQELEAVEDRLHRLDQLMLKYGSPLDTVLEHNRSLQEERAELLAMADRLEEAEAAAAKALADYATAAAALDHQRHRAAEQLTTEVAEVLGRLGMGGTRLAMRWSAQADLSSPLERDGRAVRFDENGVDECELLISPNPGEELRPMARIASGGELSRLHLALRTVLRGRQQAAGLTLLFDEVDSGLGGGIAAALAELLADLAGHDQVLVVTHLPQVAARAESHLQVTKIQDQDRTRTEVRRLDGAEREQELARMLAGHEVGASALAHARSLLEQR